MPVAEFPGSHGWGYDGVYLSAAHSAYGGPLGLQRLVDAAHALGLAVILDVVYNHVGASGDQAMEAFGPYFTDKHADAVGRGVQLRRRASRDAVREWVCQSAEDWMRDFHLDGLRLDAIHAIVDSSPEHLVAEIARRVHAVDPRALVIAESGLNDPKVMRAPEIGGWGCDAAWADDFHHALRVAAHRRDATASTSEFGALGAARQGLPPPARPRRHLLELPRAAASARPPTTCRPSASSSSPPTTTRSATARSATGCRPRRGRSPRSARSWHPSRRCCSRARSTASARRSSSSPITSTRRSPTRRARAAGASSPRSPSSPARRCPTRRTPRRSSAPS